MVVTPAGGFIELRLNTTVIPVTFTEDTNTGDELTFTTKSEVAGTEPLSRVLSYVKVSVVPPFTSALLSTGAVESTTILLVSPRLFGEDGTIV